MTTAEAAQAWAQAKEAKDSAMGALRAAEEAYKAAELADLEAWEVLQKLSGRVAGQPNVPEWGSPLPNPTYKAVYAVGAKVVPNGEYSFDDGFKR